MRLLTLTLLVFSFYSFAPADAKVFELSKWMPEGFDTRHSVLLIQNFKMGTTKMAQKACDKANNELKEFMPGNYPYKYEFVDGDALDKDPKYADKDKYRYILIDQHGTYVSTDMSMRYPTNVYHIYDRKKDKHYGDTTRTNGYLAPMFRPTIKAIVEYLKGLKS